VNLAKLLTRLHRRLGWVPFSWLMRLYPPFFMMGVRVEGHTDDPPYLKVSIPSRFWALNLNGTLFGGYICALTDPLPAIMCHRLFPGAQVWTQRHSVEFLKPIRGRATVVVEIEAKRLEAMGELIKQDRSFRETFHYNVTDERHRVVARVENLLYFRPRS